MKTVYPTAFIFRQEKNIPGVYDRKQFESYQLTVECNVREDGSGGSEATAEEEAKERKNRSNAVLDSSALLRRRKYFNKNLGEIVRQHHKVSILSLPLSLSLSLPSSLLPTLSLSPSHPPSLSFPLFLPLSLSKEAPTNSTLSFPPSQRFLSSLKPPLEIPDEKVLRWHPAFQLDTIPDVEETPLPSLPFTGQRGC